MSGFREAEGIDIVRYAEVMAHVRHFGADKLPEIIARLGIRHRDWGVAADKWKRVRDAERISGNLEVTVRYGRVLADTRAKLDAIQPSLESLGPLPGPDGDLAGGPPPSAPPVPPAAIPAPAPLAAEPVVQVPSYIAAEQRTQVQAALPALQVPPARQPAAPLVATMLGSSLPIGPVTPFVAATGPAPLGSGTLLADETAGAPRLPAGFPGLTVEQYASLRVELETSPERAAATLARYGVPADGRAALDAHWKARFAADPPLKMSFSVRYVQFGQWLKSGGGPIGAELPPPSPPPEAPRSNVGTGTVLAGEDAARPPLPPGVPDLTLEQYASLRVELKMAPEAAAAMLARYGVPLDRREALDAHWKARFAADPLLHMSFSRKYAEFVAWFKAR